MKRKVKLNNTTNCKLMLYRLIRVTQTKKLMVMTMDWINVWNKNKIEKKMNK